jgi:hypothetical protein
MSAVPELKQKKIARDAEHKKSFETATQKATADEAELNKTIFARAQKYEEEYLAVSNTLIVTHS